METTTQESLRQQLLANDPEFKRLADEHAALHAQLEALEAKQHFTPADEMEEHRLKKLKLTVKDQMNEILARHLTTSAA
jgi:uncharacterized protein YdcH (DUF465 family)